MQSTTTTTLLVHEDGTVHEEGPGFRLEPLLPPAHKEEEEEEEEGTYSLEGTPLFEAVIRDPPSVVKDILAKGDVDVNLRCGNDDEFSVLEAAAFMGRLEVMRVLLEHGVDPNGSGCDGKTALHNVVLHGWDLAHIDLLLSAGADIEARTAEGLTALHLAAEKPDSGEITAILTAILLRRGAAKDALNRPVGGRSPLHFAAQHGNISATRALLRAGADTTIRADMGYFKMSPLDVAAWHGQAKVIREFARGGVQLNATAETSGLAALHLAARRNHAGCVVALVEGGAAIDMQTTVGGGHTPLHLAAGAIALDAMCALLGRGARVLALPPVGSSQEGHGGGGNSGTLDSSVRHESPLHAAARVGGTTGAAEAVDLLLRWGADESELDNGGNIPAEVVGADLEGRSFAPDADRVRELLASAPVDRRWRRRGLLLMCLGRRRRSAGSGVGMGEGGGGGGGGVVALMMDCEREAFFRTIVGFL